MEEKKRGPLVVMSLRGSEVNVCIAVCLAKLKLEFSKLNCGSLYTHVWTDQVS